MHDCGSKRLGYRLVCASSVLLFGIGMNFFMEVAKLVRPDCSGAMLIEEKFTEGPRGR